MRVLFACHSADGHFLPLLPLARAFSARGDQVAFAVAARYADRVESAGFPILAAGIDQAELDARFATYRSRLEEHPFDERRPYAFSWRFARLGARAKIAELQAAAAEWKPDLIVHESADLAAPIVAATLNVPSAHHSFGQTIPHAVLKLAAQETEPLWQAAGLEQEPLGGVYRGVYVDICPPSLQQEDPPPDVEVARLQPSPPPLTADSPAWIADLPERPNVYVTLGTVVNALETFRVVLAALATVDCNVITTIGRNNDPAELAPIPANAIVERYIPQAEVLPHCTYAVGHGGSGSTFGALTHGLPLLLLPRAADQFTNARACKAAGVGRAVLPDGLTEEVVRSEFLALLREPSYRVAAAAVRDEIAAMPTAVDVAERLTDAVTATRPRS
jgi:UDP:flavonoid glycosyltransferase YjiC (YdhE family)